jgi:hypothetical protein
MSGSDWLYKTLKRFRIGIEGNIFILKWAICDTYGAGRRLQGLCPVQRVCLQSWALCTPGTTDGVA